jgi:hypothetical protein
VHVRWLLRISANSRKTINIIMTSSVRRFMLNSSTCESSI